MLSNILLVEDNEASRQIMKHAFRIASMAAELHLAENGDQLFQFLRKEPPFTGAAEIDLILLDLNLPGRSGIELLRELKNDSHFQKIKVVILTGSNAAKDIAACSQFHCEYRLKPTRFQELVEFVKALDGIYEQPAT